MASTDFQAIQELTGSGKGKMVHLLGQRHPLNAIGHNPLICSLRYRCECAENEVLQISIVLDKDVSEEVFVMTMKQMWRDVRFEIEQHLKPPQTRKTA